MQKHIKLFLSLLCLPALFSCSEESFPPNDGNKMEVMMTLEHQDMFSKLKGTINGLGAPAKAEDIIYRVDHGENVLFAFISDDCSSCESFLGNTKDFFWSGAYRISYIDSDTKNAANVINQYAIQNGLERTLIHPLSGGTPSIYVMSKERIVELIYGSTDNDEKVLTTAFKEYVAESKVNYSRPYYFLSSTSKEQLKAPAYILSENSKEDFYNNVYPIVSKNNKKNFNVIDVSNDSTNLGKLREAAGTEDIEGKLFNVKRVMDENDEDYRLEMTLIDDAETYLKENYISSSL